MTEMTENFAHKKQHFYKNFIDIWQNANTRWEAEEQLIRQFPGEGIYRSKMLGIVNYMRKKGIDLKHIGPDPDIDWRALRTHYCISHRAG